MKTAATRGPRRDRSRVETPYLPPETLPDEDWFADDPQLRAFLSKRLSPEQWKRLEPKLSALGRVAPREVDPLARKADAHPPKLKANAIAFHKSYGELQRLARGHRVFTDAWHGGSRLTSLALGYLYAQAECGYFCPACMTDGAAWVLARHGRNDLVDRLVQDEVEGALEGAMFLTEKTGGSDVGATTTHATAAAAGWKLTGDKWFCSNANAGVILTLARMPRGAPGTKGLGLFVVRGDAPGLTRTKLKEKLGVRSMATAECELRDCDAELVAGEGAGFKAMAEMVNLSRLYNAVTSVAIARRALREGQKNGAWRQAFGKPLSEQPLYQRSIASLAVDVRGALAFVLDCADVLDRCTGRRADGSADPSSAHAFDREDWPLMRALTPLAKAETAKLAVRAASDGCEFLGGNGYVAPWVTERLLRDAQVLPIWEGTSNVQALDFLRAVAKDRAADALVKDSLARSAALRGEWERWQADVERADEMASARLLTRGYHLRCATLLAADDDARWAAAYRVKNVDQNEPAFEAIVKDRADELCAWPEIP